MSSSITPDNAVSFNRDAELAQIEELKNALKDDFIKEKITILEKDFKTAPTNSSAINNATTSDINTQNAQNTQKESAYNVSRPSEAAIITSSIKNEHFSQFSQKIQQIAQEIESFFDNLQPAIQQNPNSKNIPQPSPNMSENSPSEIAALIKEITLNDIPILLGTLRNGLSLNPKLISFLTQDNHTTSLPSYQEDETYNTYQPRSFTKELSQKMNIPTKNIPFNIYNKKIILHLPSLPKEAIEEIQMQENSLKSDHFFPIKIDQNLSPQAVMLATLLAEINATSKILSSFMLYRDDQEPIEPYDEENIEEGNHQEDFLLHKLKILSHICKRKLKEKDICLNNGEAKPILMLFSAS